MTRHVSRFAVSWSVSDGQPDLQNADRQVAIRLAYELNEVAEKYLREAPRLAINVYEDGSSED